MGAIIGAFLCFPLVRAEEEESSETRKQLIREKSDLQTLQKKIQDREESIKETQEKEQRVLSELN